jgi:multimeric flavodoxin WrbA
MKAAIIYYSYEGHSAWLADVVKAALAAQGADVSLFRIETEDEKQRTGLQKFIWGGSQVAMGKKPPIKKLAVNPEDYDLIVIGCPVWAGNPAPPMITWIEGASLLRNCKVATWNTHSAQKSGVSEKLKGMLAGNTLVGQIDFVDPGADKEAEVKPAVETWVKSILEAAKA